MSLSPVVKIKNNPFVITLVAKGGASAAKLAPSGTTARDSVRKYPKRVFIDLSSLQGKLRATQGIPW
jgi:hypothetical protein